MHLSAGRFLSFVLLSAALFLFGTESVRADFHHDATLLLNDSMVKHGAIVKARYAFDTCKTFNAANYEKLVFKGKIRVFSPNDEKPFDFNWRMRSEQRDTSNVHIDSKQPKRIWRELVLVNTTSERFSFVLHLPVIEKVLFRSHSGGAFRETKFFRNENSLAHFIRDSILEFDLEQGDTLHLLSIIPFDDQFKVFKAKKLFAESITMVLQPRKMVLEDFWFSSFFRVTLFGIILTILLYNLVVFLALRDKIGLYYFIYFACTSFIFVDSRIIETLFGQDNTGSLSTIFMFFAGFSAYLVFVLEYIPRAGKSETIRKLLRIFLPVIFSCALVLFFFRNTLNPEDTLSILVVILTNFIAVPLIFISYIAIWIWSRSVWKKGYKPAVFLFFGNAIVVLSVLSAISALFFNSINVSLESNPWYVLGLILDALVFSFGITSRIRVLQKEKELEQQRSIELLESRVAERTLELSLKNDELANKNREITDSILYAQRLQNSMLPPLSSIIKELEKFVFLYLPKDIVAGDFYWFHSDEQGWIMAICDCTGHGVPGAMVSMVCSEALNTAVLEEKLRDPGKILDFAAVQVHGHFSSDDAVTDGMDAGILVYDRVSDSFRWSGANQPLLLIDPDGSYTEIKPDKYSIGNPPRQHSFVTHEVSKTKGQLLCMSTDGYPDQFNHQGNKKLTRKKFYELLASFVGKDSDEMNLLLRDFHYSHRGEESQTDDVLVAGILIR